ncbi:MAG TPA: hypothetical protein VJB87_03230 [Candidatus Nanoarchaeia archaeon]|nr:hypothetical protein [Candidatus Nanoarchaeia archaeon]
MVTYISRTVDQAIAGIDSGQLPAGMPVELHDKINFPFVPDGAWRWGVCGRGVPQVLLGHEYNMGFGPRGRRMRLELVHDLSAVDSDFQTAYSSVDSVQEGYKRYYSLLELLRQIAVREVPVKIKGQMFASDRSGFFSPYEVSVEEIVIPIIRIDAILPPYLRPSSANKDVVIPGMVASEQELSDVKFRKEAFHGRRRADEERRIDHLGLRRIHSYP